MGASDPQGTRRPSLSGLASGAPKGPLDLQTRLFYGVGAVAFGVKDHGFSYLLLLFYNQVLGLPAAQVGLAIMIALLVDAVLDPLVGQASDNLRSRWGRRHPFMYAAAAPAAISFILLWNPPAGWNAQALFAYLVVVAILIRSFINCYEVPSAALAAELTDDYDERTKLLSYRYLFGWIGGLTMYFSALWFFLKPDAAHPVGQLNPAGYADYGLAAAGLMFAAILTSALGTHRHVPHLHAPPQRKATPGAFAREMVQTLAHRAFLMLLLACLCNSAGIGLWLSTTLYFQTFFWEFTSAQIAMFALSSLAAVILAFIAAPSLSRRLGKRTSAILLIVTSMAIVCAPIVLRLADHFPPNGSPWVFRLLLLQNAVSTGLGIAAAILLASMVADVVEDSELRTGRRQEGLFFAVHSFVVTSVTGLGIFVSSMILSLVGFPSGARQGEVAPDVIRALGVAFVPAMATLHVAAGLLLTGYDISRAGHQAALRRLAAVRGAGSGDTDRRGPG